MTCQEMLKLSWYTADVRLPEPVSSPATTIQRGEFMRMPFEERIENAINCEVRSGVIVDSGRLLSNMLLIIKEAQTAADSVVSQLGRLLASETALTIPIGDECVAKVNFTGAINRERMVIFAKIFSAIADSYIESGR